MENNMDYQHSTVEYSKIESDENTTPAYLNFKIPDSNVTFCKYMILATVIVNFFCGIHTLEGFVRNFLLWSLLGGILLFVFLCINKVPRFVKYIITLIVVVASLPLLLNLIFSDNSSQQNYPALFLKKSITTDRSKIFYNAVYKAENGRIESVGISSDDYFTDNYPVSITLHDQQGLFGWKVDSDSMPLSMRIGRLCMVLSLFWIAAIAAYSQYNLVFNTWKGGTAIGIVIVLIAQYFANPCIALAWIVIIISLIALALAVILSVNYWRITDSRIEYVEIEKKIENKRGLIKTPNEFKFVLCTQSGIKINCNTDAYSYNNARDDYYYPLKVDIGCLRMPVVGPQPPQPGA